MISRPSLQGRAALAVALLIGFYLLAIGIAVGLLYIPYAEWVYATRVTARILIFCVGGAIAILRGILPRRDRFDPPGPIITAAEQPRLFAVVKEAAAATNQAMPAEVYLVPEVNAFVAQRGGVMGFASRRVMGVGLPLLDSLTIGQFRAVVAHEFGHYYGGDTKLGPWIYKTRAAIIRTLESLGRHSGGLLQKPFVWYGTAFSRLTLAISRRQEYVADELAARACGVRNLSQALIALERSGTAFGFFMHQEFVGVVGAGFRPPLVEGFAHFRSVPRISSRLDEHVSKEMETGEAGPYDTHPALKQRLAALAELTAIEPASESAADEERAITLVADLPKVEAVLVQSMLKSGAPALASIGWEDVPSRILTTQWAKVTQQSLPGLDGLTPTIFPEIATRLASDPDALARQLGVYNANEAELSRARAEGILGAALCVVLNERRQRAPDDILLTAPPGEPVVFRIGRDPAGVIIEPFSVLDSLKQGALSSVDWIERCRETGIAAEDLGACCRRVVESHDSFARATSTSAPTNR